MRPPKMTTDYAESIAISSLEIIARDIETLGRFLAVTGLGPSEIREAAQSPGFLRGVLEYVMSDESLLLTISTLTSLRPTEFAIARNKLETAEGE